MILGDLLVAQGAEGYLLHYRPNGTFVAAIATLGSVAGLDLFGTTFDFKGNFYTTIQMNTAPIIEKFDKDNVSQGSWSDAPFTYVDPDRIPYPISLLRDGTFLTIVDNSNAAAHDIKLWHLDKDGHFVEEWTLAWDDDQPGFGFIPRMDVACDSKVVYYTTWRGRIIHRFDISTGTQLTSFVSVVSPFFVRAVLVLKDGKVIVTTSEPAIVCYNSDGSVLWTQTNFTGLGSPSAHSMAADVDKLSIWVPEQVVRSDGLMHMVKRLISDGSVLQDVALSTGVTGVPDYVPSMAVYWPTTECNWKAGSSFGTVIGAT